MKALVKKFPQEGLWMEDVPVPEIGVNDVLIKIKKVAICGTDLHIYKWDAWSQKTIKTPMTIGHEYVGEIVDMGAGVRNLKIGDRVTGEGHIACGHCRNCRRGKKHVCENSIGVGVNRDGAFAEYLSLPAENVVKLDARISDDMDYRLDIAKKMGADIVVNPGKGETIEDAKKQLNMHGFDVGLEMSGAPSAFNSMIDNMYNGSKIALLGILPDTTQVEWSKIIFHALTLKGIYGREMWETWYQMEQMLITGLDLSPVITHRFKFDDFEKGFEVMKSGLCGKVLLELE